MSDFSSRPWTALVIDDDAGIRQSIRLCLEPTGARVTGVGASHAALAAIERSLFDVIFLDLWLGSDQGLELLPRLLERQPGVDVIVITAFATFEGAVQAIKLGASDYLPKPFTPDQVRLSVQRVREASRLRRRVAELEEQLEPGAQAWFETQSNGFKTFMALAARAANSDSVVLLRGESGTGKNVLARWIHQHSSRRDAPLASVHCPALSSELMSSTLFGHKKGAFTGAITDAPGKVQEAEGGTLLLDEVADLSADAQARLLQFLNDKAYERLGDPKERKADVRLLAATNRSLESEVESGRFREDLFYRLNVVALHVPALRERPEDILPLASAYLAEAKRKQSRGPLRFSPATEAALSAHHWPGNLRELHNAVERAVILCAHETLSPADLGLAGTGDMGNPARVGALVSLEELEREHIASVVAQRPTLEAAAKILQIDVTTLQRKRKRYGLV